MKSTSMLKQGRWILSCEEAAIEGQKEVCLCVCVSVRPCVPKTEFHLSIVNL